MGLLHLPGPRRKLTVIADEIASGMTCILVLPQHFAESQAAIEALEWLGDVVGLQDLHPQGASSVIDAVVADLGADSTWLPGADPLHDLVQWQPFIGRRYLLRSWEFDIKWVIRRWASLLMSRGLALADRPGFVFVIRHGDIDDDLLEHLDPLFVTVHWWWGVVDRIDTQVQLTLCDIRTRLPGLDRELITEIAGWDLRLLAELASNWDLDRSSLDEQIKSFQAENYGSIKSPDLTNLRAGSAKPPKSLRSAWNAGQLEIWNGRFRWLPSQVDAQDLDRIEWQAQCGFLLPRLDDQRADFERKVRRRGHESIFHGLEREDDTLEFGNLAFLVSSGQVKIPLQEREQLFCLKRVRNDLAHGRVASPRDLAVVLALVYPE